MSATLYFHIFLLLTHEVVKCMKSQRLLKGWKSGKCLIFGNRKIRRNPKIWKYFVPFLVSSVYESILYINNVFFLSMYPFYVNFLNWIHKLGKSKILIILFWQIATGYSVLLLSLYWYIIFFFFPRCGHFLLHRCYRNIKLLMDWVSPTLSPCTYRRPCVLWIKFVHIPFFSFPHPEIWSTPVISVMKILFHRD